MNINGENGLACLTKIPKDNKVCTVRPLPHLYVIKDLVAGPKSLFALIIRFNELLRAVRFDQAVVAEEVGCEHGLQGGEPAVARGSSASGRSVRVHSLHEDRLLLDGLYECILCACCSTSCPSYWWHGDKYLGPSILQQAYRWIADSRDEMTEERLKSLDDTYKLYRCHAIMNCTHACPKNLNPGRSIHKLKKAIHHMH